MKICKILCLLSILMCSNVPASVWQSNNWIDDRVSHMAQDQNATNIHIRSDGNCGGNLDIPRINGQAIPLSEEANGVSLFQIFPHVQPGTFQIDSSDDEDKLDNAIYDAKIELLDTFSDLQSNPPSALVFNFSDSHAAYMRYDKMNKMLDEILQELSNNKINVPVYVCFNGDGATKKGGKKYCEKSEYMSNCELWLKQVRDILKQYNDQSELFINFGNHDTQDTEDWLDFMEKAKEHGLIILTPFSEAFSNPQDPLKDLSVLYPTLKNNAAIVGRTLFVPYNTNLALFGLLTPGRFGGVQMNQTLNLKPAWKDYLVRCFADMERTGRPTNFFGRSIFSIDDIFSGLPQTEQKFGKKQEIPLKSAVSLFGDRHLLNPVSEVTADNIFGGISYLAQTPGPINVILMTHDHYQRLEIFLELMSGCVKKYRLDPKIMDRLHIWIAAGHEHAVYGGNNWTYLYDTQGRKWAIPTIYGGPGIYLEACNIFPIFSSEKQKKTKKRMAGFEPLYLLMDRVESIEQQLDENLKDGRWPDDGFQIVIPEGQEKQETNKTVILRRQPLQEFTLFDQYLKDKSFPPLEDDFFTHPQTPTLPDFSLITAEQLDQENAGESVTAKIVSSASNEEADPQPIPELESPSFFNKMFHSPYFWTTAGCVAIISAIMWHRRSRH